MSLINQVLNELESRGANVPLGEDTIRPVPVREHSHRIRYLFIALTLLILVVAAAWFWGRSDKPLAVKAAVVPMNAVAPASAPVLASASTPAEAASMSGASGASGALQLDASLHGKPLLEVKDSEEPVVPEAKKVAPHRSKRIEERATATGEELPPESIEAQQIKTISPQQRAENEFRKANLAAQEGRTDDALAGYESALLIDSSYKDARRAWAGMLISLKRNEEAERVLQRGLKRDSHDTVFAMMLARLQVERGDAPLALDTLQKTSPYAGGQPDYQAFMAALLQRMNRHDDAIERYQVALKLAPEKGIWLMGMGISLQALQRNDEARTAYLHALSTNSLNSQLQTFVQARLKEICASAPNGCGAASAPPPTR